MVWTDSKDYRADEILHAIKTAIFHKTTRITSEIITFLGFHPIIPFQKREQTFN
jgi:hypothetical protein